jgi:4-carboxymuconolactone decarboxylase
MDIKRAGSQPSAKGPAEYFTRTVRLDPLFQAPTPTRVAGAAVTFEPGARTAWHTHPLGQTLIVISAGGRVQRLGGAIEEIRPGVAPALQRYRDTTLQRDVWNRGGLSRRDRSLVTVAALIARQQTTDMPGEFDRALDNGIKPTELSEAITHLAFYSGWSNAMSAVAVASKVYARRNIAANQLPAASEQLLPLNEAAEQQRARQVDADFGAVAPGVVQYTRDLLSRELWLRPALAPRDRSLITASALVASGHVEQIPYHLNRAMDAGLTKPEASEALTQLAFYAGWPNVFSALPVAKAVFEKRPAK